MKKFLEQWCYDFASILCSFLLGLFALGIVAAVAIGITWVICITMRCPCV